MMQSDGRRFFSLQGDKAIATPADIATDLQAIPVDIVTNVLADSSPLSAAVGAILLTDLLNYSLFLLPQTPVKEAEMKKQLLAEMQMIEGG